MGYDVYTGRAFPGADHALTIDESLFDQFVNAHQHIVPPLPLVSRIKDAYGDADIHEFEVAKFVAELGELECHSPAEVKALCQKLRKVAGSAQDAGHSLFCRGD